MSALRDHLEGGVTTLCRCWRLRRRDGLVLGFTDHDLDLAFEGVLHRAGTGLGARALAQTTGLSVDNSEALGALSDAAIREADLLAGRFDGAEVEVWRVNWADPALRELRFRGTLGEVSRGEGAFRAELRGLAEALNQARGRVYQRPCAAVLGDGACRMDLTRPGYRESAVPASVEDGQILAFEDLRDPAERWFERGRLTVLEGAAAGLSGLIKNDRFSGRQRRVELWEPIRADLRAGERVLLEAGCDRRLDTCRSKFNNIKNFQGFPHLPSEEWILAGPRSSGA